MVGLGLDDRKVTEREIHIMDVWPEKMRPESLRSVSSTFLENYCTSEGKRVSVNKKV